MREVAAEFERPVAAVLGRQGLDRAAAPRREGVPAGAVPVPGHARRHRPQLPRGARLPRPARRRAGRAADRRVGPGVDRQGPRARGARRRPSRNRLQTDDAARRHRGAPVRLPSSAARGATRKRPAPRSASSRSATSSASGSRATQRPELWSLYNGRIRKGQHMRVFPISNWTEMDVWQYIEREGIEVPEHLLRPRARRLQARRHVAGDQPVPAHRATARRSSR